MPPSTQAFGIDTSVFLRLLTGHPKTAFDQTVKALKKRLSDHPSAEFFVSNQVIGEAYVSLQFHYAVSKPKARQAMLDLLRSGFVRPLNGESARQILEEPTSAGLIDQLIADDYAKWDLQTLTNDRKMAKLPDCHLV